MNGFVYPPGVPVHGASQHTDITRRTPLIPADAFIDAVAGSTPTLGSNGATLVNFEAWAMDGSSDEAVNCMYNMPADWDGGNVTPIIVWAPSDSSGGNVRWLCRIASIAAGEALNTALEATSGSITAAAGNQYILSLTNMGAQAPGSGTASNLLRILIYRVATDVLDTYNAHDALFVGLYLEYTANQ